MSNPAILPPMPPSAIIRPLHAATEPLLALNNAHATELSPLTLHRFNHLIQQSFYAAAIGEADALLLTFDQSADYDSPNFLWLRAHFAQERALSGAPTDADPNPNFIYVDRVVTAPAARGRGYARALYADLFRRAKSAAHSRVVCEVNFDPPNPASDAFHASLGFHEIGRAAILNHSKSVRYLLRPL